MMEELRNTLLPDGSSDAAMMPVLTWLLRESRVRCAIQESWADLRRLRKPPKTLVDRLSSSLELYPCDLLFCLVTPRSSPETSASVKFRRRSKPQVSACRRRPFV